MNPIIKIGNDAVLQIALFSLLVLLPQVVIVSFSVLGVTLVTRTKRVEDAISVLLVVLVLYGPNLRFYC